MPESVEIGMGREARRTYDLSDVAIVPSRRTRSSADVSTTWQIDAYRFEVPLVADPSDAVVSPAVAVEVGRLGGLGVINAEGLWARHPDPQSVIEYVEHGLRLVRPGGTVLVARALWRGRVADPAARDPLSSGYRTLITETAASGAVISALSPAADGLLQITKLTP